MKKKDSKGAVIQLYDSTWVPVGMYELHECCDCKKLHEIKHRWNDKKKVLEERWIVVEPKKRK